MREYFSNSNYSNINELLDSLLFDSSVKVIIIIDEMSDELNHVLAQLKIITEVIEVQTYVNEAEKLLRFKPLNDEIIEDTSKGGDADELDTIVVPARDDGFQEVFVKENQWYAIRISAGMIGKIKYVAAYRSAPTSAITHYAEVERIEKYEETNKYIIFFKPNTLKKINRISCPPGKGYAPQSPRYTSLSRLNEAKTLQDLWI